MKLLYWKTGVLSGDVFFAVYDTNWIRAPHRQDGSDWYLLKGNGSDNTHVAALLFEIDEVDPGNIVTMADVLRTNGKRDVNGRSKYYVSGGALYSRDNWVEYEEDFSNG